MHSEYKGSDTFLNISNPIKSNENHHQNSLCRNLFTYSNNITITQNIYETLLWKLPLKLTPCETHTKIKSYCLHVILHQKMYCLASLLGSQYLLAVSKNWIHQARVTICYFWGHSKDWLRSQKYSQHWQHHQNKYKGWEHNYFEDKFTIIVKCPTTTTEGTRYVQYRSHTNYITLQSYII